MLLVVALRIASPLVLRMREPSVDAAAFHAGQVARIPEQGAGRVVLHEHFVEHRHDEGRGVGEPVQHAQQARREVLGERGAVGRAVPADPVEVVALVGRQPQSPGQGRQHLHARLRPAALLEARVVVGRHGCQHRDLLTTQAGGATTRPGAESDIGRHQLPASAQQEVGECITIHPGSIPRGAHGHPGTADPWMTAPCRSTRVASRLRA